MPSGPQQNQTDATSNVALKNIWAILHLMLCRPSPPNHQIPIEKLYFFAFFKWNVVWLCIRWVGQDTKQHPFLIHVARLSASACASRQAPCVPCWIASDYQSINDSLNSLFVNISLGAGEILTFWHHMKLIIPAELWGHITHISVYLWGILLDGGMTEKETKSLCRLSTFAWTFPATSAEHFLAFAFLATTF